MHHRANGRQRHPGDSALTGRRASHHIQIRGARVHNLRNVDLDIPHRQFVVLTGPSGSGKSSLAFDTLYAEGQRQYIESLSVYARQFLRQLERPDVDLIEGLQPTLCIDQRPGAHNPRSTVATVTEIYDYLRLLMARRGEASCPQCGQLIRQQSVEQIQQRLLQLEEGTKMMLLAPLVRGRRGQHKEVFAQIRKAGFVRARVDNRVYDLEQVPELAPRKLHHIDAVVDRVIARSGQSARIAESLRLALQHGEGLAVACILHPERATEEHPQGVWIDELFSTRHACPDCNLGFEELEPRTFSFNSPYGACPACDGLGVLEGFDPELVLPDLELSLEAGAIAPWATVGKSAKGLTKKRQAAVDALLDGRGELWKLPLAQWRKDRFERFLYGHPKNNRLGLLTLLEQEYVTTTKPAQLEQLQAFRGVNVCHHCQGSRLRAEARSVRYGGRAIHEIAALSVGDALEFFERLPAEADECPLAGPLLNEIRQRLRFLLQVGLDYLTLDRAANTLSGGERQRVRLATSIGSALVGVCYILDEPSIGLHPRDNERLIAALRNLERLGNSVLVVEHDETMIREADQVIDVGPGAGTAGGRIVAQGTVAEVSANADSPTGRYLSGAAAIPLPGQRRKVSKGRSLQLLGATTNNLKEVSVRFPLGALVCLTGVSGSGKSSLINETLAPAVRRRLGGGGPRPGPHQGLRGVAGIDKLIQIDQSPIGRSPRSNPATYLGAFDEIRKVFAGTRDAKQRGYKASRFSFNVKGGRCEDCQGQGMKKIEMNFLPDLYVPCGTCRTARFNAATLQVRYRGKSIADVLAMAISEAVEFFENFSTIARLLQAVVDVGLGYLQLGQPSTTLSGGEAQRLKLAAQLARVETGKTLYLLDEPTTGLHFDDIRNLLHVLNQLVDRGNTAIVIEHHLDVIKCADWVIDLGPEGGVAGGQVLAEGPPETLAALKENLTGQFLRPLLEREQ